MQNKISQIQQVASELKEMEEDKERLFERINNLSPDAISQLIEDYKKVLKAFKPVNLLRYEVLKALEKGNKVDEDFVENLKERIRKKDTEYFAHYGDDLTEGLRNYREGTKDIFTNWQSPFRIFYSFFYFGDTKERILNYLEDISQDIANQLNVDDLERHYVDFKGPQNFGATYCWIAVYPKEKISHQKAYQFFLQIGANSLEAGMMPGSDLKKKKEKDTSVVETYDEAVEKLRSLKDTIIAKNKNYWKYLIPGENTEYWDEMYQNGFMAIGWDELGDISNKTIDDLNNSGNPEIQNAINNWNIIQNFRDASIGDVVIAEKDMVNVYGIGVITSQYYFDDTRKHFKHLRQVKWLINELIDFEEPIFGPDTFSRTRKWKEIKDRYSKLNAEYQKILKEIEQGEISIEEEVNPEKPEPYSYQSDPDKPFIDYEEIGNIETALKLKKNIVLQGPPGTGKTFIARKIAWDIMGKKDNSKIEMIQFHQSYSYEDFIQGIRPVGNEFRVKNGVFYNFC